MACSSGATSLSSTSQSGLAANVRMPSDPAMLCADDIAWPVPKQESDCRRPIGHPLQLAQVGSQQEELPTKPAVLYNYLQPPQTQNHQAQSKQVRALGQHSRRRRDYEYTSFCSLWRIAGCVHQLASAE